MQPLAVYSTFDLTLTRAKGCYIYDQAGREILDFYSGHGVISLGHSHPYFVEVLQKQLAQFLYYSNVAKLKEQSELCTTLGRVSGCEQYDLFLSNSGAEAVENALKAASFVTGRSKVVCMLNSFHGRTSLAAQCTEASKVCAPINSGLEVSWVALNDMQAATDAIDENTAAVIIEGIQGVGGVREGSSSYWQHLAALCKQKGALLIADEIQSGYGRSGKFFAFQHHGVEPDLICTAKGMGNGYPVAATWVKQGHTLAVGSLGTTFGGNPMACAAALAVSEVIEREGLCARAHELGAYLRKGLSEISGVSDVRGRGLMIGFDIAEDCGPLRHKLLMKHQIMTGNARQKTTLRLLPPLTIERSQCDYLLEQLDQALGTP